MESGIEFTQNIPDFISDKNPLSQSPPHLISKDKSQLNNSPPDLPLYALNCILNNYKTNKDSFVCFTTVKIRF